MEHPCELAERVRKLLFDARFSDVTFIVEGKRLPAHRNLVATSCDYFRALLDGNMRESIHNEVVLQDVPLRGFKLLMNFIYTGQLKIYEADEDSILEVLGMSHMWGFETLETKLSQHLEESLSIHNVINVYGKVHHLQIRELYDACRCVIEENPNAILASESLWDLPERAFCDMLSWDAFCAEEIDIFTAALDWHLKRQPGADPSVLLNAIRLPLIDTKDLVTKVQDSGLIPADVLIGAIRQRESCPTNLNFRGRLERDINLASPVCGALRLKAKDRGSYATRRKCDDYDMQDMPHYSWEHTVPISTGLTVALREPFLINNINFHFLPSFSCSYYIEVSMNLVDWVRIIDHTKFRCRSRQNLYFEQRAAHYIRLIVTWISGNKDDLKLKNLEITYSTSPFELSYGFYAPQQNIAIQSLGANAYPPSCTALIDDGNRGDEGEPKRWASNRVGNGSILVELPQPYTVSSMRMLLRNDESQGYRYYIETSVDYSSWTRVADHSSHICRSWQNIVFDARPVVWIRIVGTESTVDKDFSCAFFECPAPRTIDAGNPARSDEVDVSGDNKL